MNERPPVQNRIIAYAFQNPDCDLDHATFKVLRDIIFETTAQRSEEGLYDRLFAPTENRQQQ